MSRRRRFKPQLKSDSTFFLNLNSMVDMFTIMLVFLLQTYSTSMVDIDPAKGLRLPSSNSMLNPLEGVRLTLSKEELKLGEQKLASLEAKHFSSGDVDRKDPDFLPILFAELNKLAGDKEKVEHREGRILLQADAGLPYETLRKVMYTASMAGFPQMKLVTMVGN